MTLRFHVVRYVIKSITQRTLRVSFNERLVKFVNRFFKVGTYRNILFRKKIKKLGEGKTLQLNSSLSSESKRPTVIDAFRFFNEFDILLLRLKTLWEYVDYFVITESNYTHSGQPKKLNFDLNKELFSEFKSKIIYNPIIDVPQEFPYEDFLTPYRLNWNKIDPNSKHPFKENSLSYKREAFERDEMIRGVMQIQESWKKNTIIMSSDLDEIPNPELLKNLSWVKDNKLYVLEQRAFMYRINWLYMENWYGTRIFNTSYLHSKTRSLHEIHAERRNVIYVKNGGWHFTWIGDEKKFSEKLSAQPETIFNTFERQKEIKEIIARGEDPFGREIELVPIKIDKSFPKPIFEGEIEFEHLIDKNIQK